jgi:hypothetical protein
MASPQYRYADGVIYRRDPSPYSYDLRIHDLGHGQVEALAMPRYAWTELDATPEALSRAADAQGNVWDSANGEWVPSTSCGKELEERAAANRERSARRARTQVRRLIKAKNLDTMLTLTYRENMADRARMARDFDVFMKRIRRILPHFQYVCVFERQKRGAWHAHMAVQRVQSHYLHRGVLVKSYDLLRAVWRAVVGEGNVDISKARRHSQRNIAKLAGYLSKYLSKTFDDGGEGDSYRASGKALPKPVVIRSLTQTLDDAGSDLLGLLFKFYNLRTFHHAYLDCGGVFVSITP